MIDLAYQAHRVLRDIEILEEFIKYYSEQSDREFLECRVEDAKIEIGRIIYRLEAKDD